MADLEGQIKQQLHTDFKQQPLSAFEYQQIESQENPKSNIETLFNFNIVNYVTALLNASSFLNEQQLNANSNTCIFISKRTLEGLIVLSTHFNSKLNNKNKEDFRRSVLKAVLCLADQSNTLYEKSLNQKTKILNLSRSLDQLLFFYNNFDIFGEFLDDYLKSLEHLKNIYQNIYSIEGNEDYDNASKEVQKRIDTLKKEGS